MKKLMVAVAVLAVASSSMAMFGQPLAQEASPIDQGKIVANAGVVVGFGDNDDIVLGARGTYGVIENLLISVDVGYAFDAEMAGIAVNGQYALAMLKLPVDLAVRVGIGLYDFDMDLLAADLMACVSKKIEQVDGLAVYGGLGFELGIGDALENNIMAAAGATYALPVENLSLYAELDYLDDLAVAAGARYGF